MVVAAGASQVVGAAGAGRIAIGALIDRCRGLAHAAVNDVDLAAIGQRLITIEGADEQIGKTVAIDIAGRRHRRPGVVPGALTDDAKAAAGHVKRRHFHRRIGGLAVHHIGVAGIGSCGIGHRRADQEVGQAVAVDITCIGDRYTHRAAGAVALGVDDKPTSPSGNGRGLQRGACGASEDHIDTPGSGADPGGQARARRTDHQIGQAVTIDVACLGYAGAKPVAGAGAMDDKAAGARIHGRQIDGGAAGAAKHHISTTGIGSARGVGLGRAQDDVGQTVAIDIASGTASIDRIVAGKAVDHQPFGCRQIAQIDHRGA